MVDYELYYEMRNIIKTGNLEKMKQIINNYGLSYFSVWDNGYQLLIEACVKKQSHLVEYLLSKNAKINCDNALITPLQVAVLKNNTKSVELLLEHGAKAYANKNEALLRIAIERKNFEIARLLFEHNAVNKSIQQLSDTLERPALHLAVLSGEYSMVKLLLENGFNVNINDSEGLKSIHLAIRLRLLNIVQLLEFDADVNAKTEDGYTRLFLTISLSHRRYINDEYPASSERDSKILKLLLDYKADINIGNPYNISTLYFANTFTREHFFFTFWDEDNLRKIESLISQVVKLRSQDLYISAGNFLQLWSISENRFMRYCKMCYGEMFIMIIVKIPNTTISLHNFITKNDNYLASCVKNDNIKRFVLSDTIVNLFPIYASTVRTCFSRGVRRKFLLEESVKIFEKNWPYPSKLLANCLVYVFKNLNNNDLHEFIWMFKQEN